jgi:hypothetical protein
VRQQLRSLVLNAEMQAAGTSLRSRAILQPFQSHPHVLQHGRCVEVHAAKGFGTIAKKGFGLVKKQDFWG